MNMEKFRRLSVTLILFAIQHCSAGRYDKYGIFNVYVQNDRDYKLIKSFDTGINKNVIFPERPLERGVVQVLVHKNYEEEFRNKLYNFKVRIKQVAVNAQEHDQSVKLNNFSQEKLCWETKKISIRLTDLQWVFDNQLNKRTKSIDSIKTLDGVYEWLHEAANNTFAKLFSIGQSSEGREIYVFSIENPIRPGYVHSKAVIESSLHGNEWSSTTSTLYMIDQVLNATEGPYSDLKNKHFLYFIPVANPDGYEYSQKNDRLWKKNRRKTGEDTYGVNLNRNFDYKFGELDSSNDPNSQYYRGPYPFSEPETLHLKNFITKKGHRIAFYLSVHGYGQRFILPYSDSTKHVVNYHEVQTHARVAVSQINGEHTRRDFTQSPYRVGLAHEIYSVRYTGDSASWVKKNFHVPFTVTFQLCDEGELGIAAPNSNLPSTAKEMSEGLTSFMLSTGYFRSYDEYDDAATRVQSKLVYVILVIYFLFV